MLFVNNFLGTINASNASAGTFGVNTEKGNYSFLGNVGIRTTAPRAKLHVRGDAIIEGNQLIDQGGLFIPNGRVGIGTREPIQKLHVVGNVAIIGNVGIETTEPTEKIDVAGKIKATGICIGNDCRTSWSDSGYWAAKGENIYNTNSGNVGIGTGKPNAKLTIQSRNALQGTLSFFPKGTDISYDGGSDKLFIFAANGGTVTSFMGGKIGIGTPKPTKQLEVNGTMGFSGGKGPFCIFSNVCPSGWVDKGLGGYIYNSGGGAT